MSLPPGSVRPDYSGYNLSNVPWTIQSILGVKGERPGLPSDALGRVDTAGIDNVVLMLVDGLGYREWQRQNSKGFFGALSRKGSVMPITTIFPSTTSAALTSLCTGLTPQEHGLPEWYVYMRELGEVVRGLWFNRVGDKANDTLKGELPPRALFDGATIYQRLKREGVRSTTLTNRFVANSVYSKYSRRGAGVVPYSSASDLTVSLRRLVEGAKGLNYFNVYWSYVDHVEHRYGPNTDEAEVEASLISHALEEGFLSKLGRDAAGRTLVLVTADHGQVLSPPEEMIYTNRLSKLVRAFERNQMGKPIPPWGAPRDSYLQIKESMLDETQEYLAEKFDGIATILKTDEALKDGLFGLNRASTKFRRRVGNLMILPHGTGSIWYKYEEESPYDFPGHHGGLSKDEMTIPLAAGRVSDLQR
jgi:predicted AlkP superfamily pyrophosphatase or phosphodiesterase